MTIFKQQDVDIVYGNIDYVDHAGKSVGAYIPPEKISLAESISKFSGAIPPQPGVFFKRRLFHSVGGFDVSFKVAGDIEFWVKILSRQPKSLYRNKTFGSYRLEQSGASRSLSGMRTGLKEMMKIYRPYMHPVYGRFMLIRKYLGSYLYTLVRFYGKQLKIYRGY